MKEITTSHLVLGQDINHHNTLFAGRAAEWFVEAGYMAATSALGSNHVVCVAIHELSFYRPTPIGESILFRSSVVYAGRSSLVSYVSASLPSTQEQVLEGFIRFVQLDENGKPQAHGLKVVAETDKERILQEKAKSLR